MIKLDNVSKFFFKGKPNEIKALQNISLEMDEGLVMLVGKSGCGKTTLLNTVGGLEKPDCGSVTIDDVTIKRYQCEQWDKLRNRAIGYVFQNYNLIDELSVAQNLELVLKLAGIDPATYEERIHYALSLVGMEKYAKRYPNSLSGGQQQRVGIARAIVKGARIIIADEPTGNLDDTNTIAVMELLKGLSKHCLVVVVTHEEDLAAFYADRIIRMKDGCIIEDSQNSGEGSLEHRAADHIYLGDMERRDFDAEGMKISLYQDNALPDVQVRIVCQNGRILLKVEGENKVTYVTENSSIVLDEGRYVPRQKNDDELPINIELLTKGSGKPHRVFTFRECLKDTFARMLSKWGVRRHNPYRLLYTTAVFFVIMLALSGPAFLYDRDANVVMDDNALAVAATVNVADLPEGTMVLDRAVLGRAYIDMQFADQAGLFSLTDYYTSYLMVMPYSAVGGTANDGEIYIDKLLYDRLAKNNTFDGFARNTDDLTNMPVAVVFDSDYPFYLTQNFEVSSAAYDDPMRSVSEVPVVFRLGGVVNRNMPVIYLSDADYARLDTVHYYYNIGSRSEIKIIYNKNLRALKKALKAKDITAISINIAAKREFYRDSMNNKIFFFILAGVVLIIMIFGMARMAKNEYVGKIKLYAQYRSIGVSRSAIYGKISMESAIVSTGTSLRGWLITSVFVLVLQSFDIIRRTNIIYYPIWFAVVCGAFLFGLSQVVNLLSPAGLLAHTPAKLMTKYDI